MTGMASGLCKPTPIIFKDSHSDMVEERNQGVNELTQVQMDNGH